MNINIAKICSAIKIIKTLPESKDKEEALLALDKLLSNVIKFCDWRPENESIQDHLYFY